MKVLRQQGLKSLQVPQCLHILLLARLIVGVDEDEVFSTEIFHAVNHHVHQGHLFLVLPVQSEGAAQVS